MRILLNFTDTKFRRFSEEVFLLIPSLIGEMILFTFSDQTSEINVKKKWTKRGGEIFVRCGLSDFYCDVGRGL